VHPALGEKKKKSLPSQGKVTLGPVPVTGRGANSPDLPFHPPLRLLPLPEFFFPTHPERSILSPPHRKGYPTTHRPSIGLWFFLLSTWFL